MSEADHTPMYYVKIWVLLLVLLVISILGPEFNIEIVTLITAFGVAGVKAYIVAAKFMHLNVEKKFVWFMLISMVLFTTLFMAGSMVDVMKPTGSNWEKPAVVKHLKEYKEGKVHGNSSEHH